MKVLFTIFFAFVASTNYDYAVAIDALGIFQNPIFDLTWPDPYCYLHSDGFYYMPRKENVSIALYRSPILHNWREAEKAIIYTAPAGLLNLWAPEIHFIQNQFYIYFALDNGNNANHRMYVIQAVNPSNPMGFWTTERRIVVPGKDYWAIDATVLQHKNGQLYFIWSGWPKIDAEFPQNLYIAPMSGPDTVSGERVLINEPTLDWQMHGAPLLEGPQVLVNGNRTFIVYSCSGSWTPDYQLGIMGIEGFDDPLIPENWWRHDQPVFRRNDEAGVYGVGHASFTTSKDLTESWIVYHAMADPDSGWPGRTSRIQKFEFNNDSFPVFPEPVGFETLLETPSGE